MLGNLFTGNGAGMGAGRPTMPTPKPDGCKYGSA